MPLGRTQPPKTAQNSLRPKCSNIWDYKGTFNIQTIKEFQLPAASTNLLSLNEPTMNLKYPGKKIISLLNIDKFLLWLFSKQNSIVTIHIAFTLYWVLNHLEMICLGRVCIVYMQALYHLTEVSWIFKDFGDPMGPGINNPHMLRDTYSNFFLPCISWNCLLNNSSLLHWLGNSTFISPKVLCGFVLRMFMAVVLLVF